MNNENHSEGNSSINIKEIIVVEGRDDTCAVKRLANLDTIETHGFGINKSTYRLLDKAYETRGLIIFTDPDGAGERIRKTLTERYPDAKHAFLVKKDAYSKGDVGIENASPQSIKEALLAAKSTIIDTPRDDAFTREDLYKYGLLGNDDSKEVRQRVAKELSIGYANGSGFLKKLNQFNVTREELEKVIYGR